MPYKDPKQQLCARINDLMKRMTLEEKIGQMTQIERSVASNVVINNVLSGGGSVPSKEASPETWVDMVNDFQKGSLSTRLGIPDPVLVQKIGAATTLEVRATGIQYAFAPCIAVCRDPRWGRCFESYSEDPKIVRQMTEIIPGLQGEIPSGSEKGAPFVQGHVHMPAYNDSIIKGVATIMTSYSSWNGVKMHANRNLVTDYLKNKLYFKGFVISDWQGIDSITTPTHANYTFSILAGMNAGIDMFMIPLKYTEFMDGLTQLPVHIFSYLDVNRVNLMLRAMRE
ncbi:Glycoside hydrolase family 3 [Cynara cardunculus var. scolymus]|uniref:Glycoside hydrolase family 3 n=1 Tax=Cynara cardunculus var. scolymus TaxID=59895 RepID=A0A103Y5T3_CYNCS|nr:Glycoside hydrolase family 3 [Cynara cardunculus var. scolymus]